MICLFFHYVFAEKHTICDGRRRTVRQQKRLLLLLADTLKLIGKGLREVRCHLRLKRHLHVFGESDAFR